jgi:hypothetical protein
MMIILAIALIVAGIWLAFERLGLTKTIYWSNATTEKARLKSNRDSGSRDGGSVGVSVGGIISAIVEPIAGAFDVERYVFPTAGARGRTAGRVERLLRRHFVGASSRREREYDGEFSMPARAYEATSRIISVTIRPGLWKPMRGSARLLEIVENGRPRFSALIPEAPANSQSFEVEVLAPELTIEGEKKQRKVIANQKISFHWGCGFPKKGSYEVALIVRVVSRETVTDLGEPIVQKLKVVKRFGLSKQAVAFVAAVLTATGTVLGIVETGQKLHWW